MSEPRRVLYAWPYLEWGGVQIYFLGLMSVLVRRVAIECVWPEGGAATLDGYLRPLGLHGSSFGPATPARAARGLAERVAFLARRTLSEARLAFFLLRHSDGGTVLHCDLSPFASFTLLRGLSLWRPVCVTLHTAWPRLGGLRGLIWRTKLHWLLRCPRFELLAANEDVRRSLAPYAPAARLAHVPIAYSTFDGDEVDAVRQDPLTRSQLERLLGLARDCFLVVTVGQLIERKGYVQLLAAARALLEREPGFQFLWLATAPPSPVAQARLEAAGLGQRFRVLEPSQLAVTRRELLRAVQAADVFALPSLEEGLPLALVEALALERPVVATSVNAIPEAVVHGESGLLVPPGDVAALTHALFALRSDPVLRARLARNGRAFACTHFEQRVAAEITWQAYLRASADRAGDA